MTHLQIGVALQQTRKAWEALDQLETYFKQEHIEWYSSLFCNWSQIHSAKITIAAQIVALEKLEKTIVLVE